MQWEGRAGIMKKFHGVQLIDKAIATKAILEARRLAMLEDFQVICRPRRVQLAIAAFGRMGMPTDDVGCTMYCYLR